MHRLRSWHAFLDFHRRTGQAARSGEQGGHGEAVEDERPERVAREQFQKPANSQKADGCGREYAADRRSDGRLGAENFGALLPGFQQARRSHRRQRE